MNAAPLTVPRTDPTAHTAIARVARTERATAPLTVPLGAFVGASLKDDWFASKFGRDVINAAARAQGGR